MTSAGVPMMLAGDEIGRTQAGNNNGTRGRANGTRDPIGNTGCGSGISGAKTAPRNSGHFMKSSPSATRSTTNPATSFGCVYVCLRKIFGVMAPIAAITPKIFSILVHMQ
jgi:hypothetical protein